MFRLNLKIALRNLWRHKTSSFINITGLAIGLAACLMLMFYVSYEWNFDKQAKDSDRVFQVMTNLKDNAGAITFTFNGTTTALGPILKESIPEIESVSRLNYGRVNLIANGQNSFKKNAVFAEPTLFTMYDYVFISGSPGTAMANPRSVLLTETMAKTLFGTADVVGKTVRYEDKEDLTVTAVIKDLPENSSNRFDFLMPWSLFAILDPGARELSWSDFSYLTLVKLRPGFSADQVNRKLGPLLKKYNNGDQQHFLYPLSKLHLYGSFEQGKSVGGAIEQIRLFVILAAGILLIACINFMNMATAKSERRAKDVGVKKTIGANRFSLIMQFLTESVVLAAISVVVAIALIELSLPMFNNLLSIKMDAGYFGFEIWGIIIGMVILTGLIAGSYPAFYLSSFDPISGMKKKIRASGLFTVSLRQVLVTGQFCFTVMLFISTIVIYKQIQFIKNRPIGASINALVELPQDGTLKDKYDVFKTMLLRSGAVTAVTHSSVP
ncbi:MAG: ABC transporter permease, partial [Pedobacter sp.]